VAVGLSVSVFVVVLLRASVFVFAFVRHGFCSLFSLRWLLIIA
jgi:hypothetical protein